MCHFLNHREKEIDYIYGSRGSGKLFWIRFLCKHRFRDYDIDGNLQRCTKCGLYRSVLKIRRFENE